MAKDAVVFILLGQSNAVGHALPMADTERITEPLHHVFGLSREKNQFFGLQPLQWDGYISAGMNLGESQDHTWSVANCLAKQWQKSVDDGRTQAELYIVQIAIGAQGVTEEYMWYPNREPRLVPGPLGTVDISLHPLTKEILSLLPDSMAAMGKNARYILHWRGGENDMTVPPQLLEKALPPIYRQLFGDYRKALNQDIPIVLHRLICRERAMEMDPSGQYLESMHVINRVFQDLAQDPATVLFDVRQCPLYEPDTRQHGIFLEDAVHFTPQVNDWVAGQILNTLV